MKLLFFIGEPLLLGYLEEAWKLTKTIAPGSRRLCEKAQAPSGGNDVLLFLLEKKLLIMWEMRLSG